MPFDRSISARAEELQRVSPGIRRLIANNGGPFTFTGTCSYIVGRGEVAVIDPGPNDPSHLHALLDAVAGETVRHILVTHTHRDHSPGAAALREATGAEIVGCRPRRPAAGHEAHPHLDAGFDRAYAPDRILGEGDGVEGPAYRLFAVETPGHTSDHLAFGFPAEGALFSGDHVMAWSTTVVVPPDGSMRAYMASLRKLIGRDDTIYWPGHGGPVRQPRTFVNALLVHRQWREAAILRCLAAGDATVATIVGRIYRDLAPALRGGASQSVLAHLVDLVDAGRVVVDGPPTLRAHYRAV
ncbi:MAG TPA: MBL fold metallo-hydrolase [Lichenihabitans sp.]|nr:MBL fold metallo-hydrolase [Lichenihabitans sp.]